MKQKLIAQIKGILRQRGVKYKQLAYMLGVKPSTVYSYLRDDNNIEFDTIEKICDAIG